MQKSCYFLCFTAYGHILSWIKKKQNTKNLYISIYDDFIPQSRVAPRLQRANAKSSLTPGDGWLISPLHHHKDTSNCTPTVNHWSPLPEVCAHSTL